MMYSEPGSMDQAQRAAIHADVHRTCHDHCGKQPIAPRLRREDDANRHLGNSMDQLSITDITWRGLPAWRVTGASRTVVISAIGGHLVAFTDVADELNPLWQPQWQAADPAQVRPGPDCPWGRGSEAYVLAGIAGSNLCVPNFGAAPPGTHLPMHGDAGVSRWSRIASDTDVAVFGVQTPISRLTVERRFRLDGETLELATTVSHRDDAPRDIDWCEHTTLGGDFLDDVLITAGIDAAWTPTVPSDPSIRLRNAGIGTRLDPATALAVPAADAPPCGDVLAARVTDGWWQARNARLGWSLSARWLVEEFPWMTLWTQHRERTLSPWRGRERTRGMELGCQPFPGGLPHGMIDGTWQGVPVGCRIPVGSGLTKTLRLRWSRLDPGNG
jgi:hypothetical protein